MFDVLYLNLINNLLITQLYNSGYFQDQSPAIGDQETIIRTETPTATPMPQRTPLKTVKRKAWDSQGELQGSYAVRLENQFGWTVGCRSLNNIFLKTNIMNPEQKDTLFFGSRKT